MKKIAPIPEGYHSITPYLIVHDASGAIQFYKQAFNAKEVMRLKSPDEKICHSEISIGDSKIMLADEYPEMDARAPKAYGGSPITIHLYVNDVDALVKQAVAVGATVIRPLQNMFYGDRAATLQDPYGYKWHVATHVEDVSEEEIRKRSEQMFAQKA